MTLSDRCYLTKGALLKRAVAERSHEENTLLLLCIESAEPQTRTLEK